ncbi:MAG: hypothetical protein M0P70_07655 [Desulfobulbaceae bacterium]|nr:hypothetical protein [Desulfobulbaceae bacterium]
MISLRPLFLLAGLICLFSLLTAEVWAEGPGTGQAVAEKSGNLQLLLAIKQNPVIFQEDVEGVVLLKNCGAAPLVVKFPQMDQTMPIVRVSPVSTGGTQRYQRQAGTSPRFSSDLTLAVGAVVENSFSLRDIVPLLPPDEYSISVFWRYDNDTRTAESNGVRLVVLPSRPANLQLVDAVGGQGGLKYGVWLNSGSKHPAIFRGDFSFTPGGGVQNIVQVAAAGPDTHPVSSAPGPGSPLQGQWIAWLAGEVIHYSHVDAKREVLPPQQLPLPAGGTWEIVPPLAEEPGGGDQPAAALLLCGSGTSAEDFRLQTVRLGEDRAEMVAHATLPGPKPLWLKNLVLGDGKQYLAYLQSDGKNVALHLVSWPGLPGDLPKPRRLSGWSGNLLAAQAAAGQDSVMRGAILLQDGKDLSRPALINWSLPHDTLRFTEQQQAMNWPVKQQIASAAIGISDSGQTAVIIQAGEGNWYGAAGDGPLTEIPAKVTKDLLVHEVGFADGQDGPVLLTGSEADGFRIQQFAGSPLPLPSSQK